MYVGVNLLNISTVSCRLPRGFINSYVRWHQLVVDPWTEAIDRGHFTKGVTQVSIVGLSIFQHLGEKINVHFTLSDISDSPTTLKQILENSKILITCFNFW